MKLTSRTHINRRVKKLTQSCAEFISVKKFATCGGWRSCSSKIWLKSSILLCFYSGNEPNFNNCDLRGLSAPKVPLKKLRETLRQLLYSAVKCVM